MKKAAAFIIFLGIFPSIFLGGFIASSLLSQTANAQSSVTVDLDAVPTIKLSSECAKARNPTTLIVCPKLKDIIKNERIAASSYCAKMAKCKAEEYCQRADFCKTHPQLKCSGYAAAKCETARRANFNLRCSSPNGDELNPSWFSDYNKSINIRTFSDETEKVIRSCPNFHAATDHAASESAPAARATSTQSTSRKGAPSVPAAPAKSGRRPPAGIDSLKSGT